MKAAYQTLIVKFSQPIKVLDGIFDDAEAWGVDTLKGWIDDYESSRFTAINSHTAVITSEYNMECLMEWLKRNTPIAEITTTPRRTQRAPPTAYNPRDRAGSGGNNIATDRFPNRSHCPTRPLAR